MADGLHPPGHYLQFPDVVEYVTVAPRPGALVSSVGEQMVWLADLLKVRVQTEHNDRPMHAEPGESVAEVVNRMYADDTARRTAAAEAPAAPPMPEWSPGDRRHPAHAVLVQALAPRLVPEQTALRGGAEHLAHEAVIALSGSGLLLAVDEPMLKHAGSTLGEVEAWARGVKDALGKGWSYREDLGESTKFRDGFESAVDALSSHLDDMRDAR